MRKSRHLIRLMVIAPILALVVCTLLYIGKMSRELTRQAPGMISAAVTDRVNGEVRIGKVEIHPLGIVLRDVSVYDATGNPLMSSPRVKVALRLMDVIRGTRNMTSAISKVEVSSPIICLERYADGRWNVSQLLKPSAPGKTPFRGKVIIRDARLSLLDRKPDPHMPVLTRASKVEAVVDFAASPDVKFSAWGNGVGGRFGHFTANRNESGTVAAQRSYTRSACGR